MKFTLNDANGALVSDTVARLNLKRADNNPDAGVDEAVSTSASTEGILFCYDAANGQYIFNPCSSFPTRATTHAGGYGVGPGLSGDARG